MSYHQPTTEKGFIILFSVLVSSIILLLSAGIFNVVQKEVILSSSARESQRAFYAADSALECALYADVVGISSPPATPFTITPTGSQISTFECGGATVNSYYLEDSGGTDGYDYPYVFRYYNSYGQGGCAYVLVEKNEKGTDTTLIETRITAVGFNICVDNTGAYSGPTNVPDFDDPTLLERRLSITYTQ